MLISVAAASLVLTNPSEYHTAKGVWKKFIVAAKSCREKGNVNGGIELYKKGLLEANKEGLDASSLELTMFLEKTLWL